MMKLSIRITLTVKTDGKNRGQRPESLIKFEKKIKFTRGFFMYFLLLQFFFK